MHNTREEQAGFAGESDLGASLRSEGCVLFLAPEPTPAILGFAPRLPVSSFAFLFLLVSLLQLLCPLPGSAERKLLQIGRGLASAAVPRSWCLAREPRAGPAMAGDNLVRDGAEFVPRLLCGLPALPEGWFGSPAVPGPRDLPSVHTVPRPAEEVVAECHAGIPFPRGCQVKAA